MALRRGVARRLLRTRATFPTLSPPPRPPADVFMVEGSAGRLLLKCGGPSAKGDPGLPVDQARVATEAAVMALAHAAAPAHSPALLLHDPTSHTLAAEFLEGRETLTAAVCRGAVHPRLASHAGAALAAIGTASMPGALGGAAHAELAATLAASDSVAGIIEQFALYSPFDPDDASGRQVRAPLQIWRFSLTLPPALLAIADGAAALYTDRGQQQCMHARLHSLAGAPRPGGRGGAADREPPRLPS